MGFYAPAQLLKDARHHGVVVRPVGVNESDYDSTLEFDEDYLKPDSPCHHNTAAQIRIGLRMVKGLSQAGAKAIAEARQGGQFESVQDLVFRSGINRKDLEALAAADALRQLSGDRHRAFWLASGIETAGQGKQVVNAGGQTLQNEAGKPAGQLSTRGMQTIQNEARIQVDQLSTCGTQTLFFSDADFDTDFGIDVLLPVASEGQNIVGDYTSTGFSLRRHPLALFRTHLNNFNVSRADELPNIDNEGTVKVTGLVTCRQRPMTAAGVTFLTLEDESGFVNVVVWPSLGERQRPVVRQAMLMGVVGHVQKSEGVIHLIAKELVDLSHWLGTMEVSSRDFT